jgi:hypothetical protein
MISEQLNLLNYAISELSSLQNQGLPMPLDTKTVCNSLDISPSTLNKAKKNKIYLTTVLIGTKWLQSPILTKKNEKITGLFILRTKIHQNDRTYPIYFRS